MVVAVGASLVAGEILLRRHVVPNDPYEIARQAFHTGGTPFAAFGDSRVESGIAHGDQIANFGTPSDSLATVLGKTAAWLARNPAGRAVIALPPQQFSAQRLGIDQHALLQDFVSGDTATLQVLRPNHRRFLLEYVIVVITDPEILWRPPGIPRQTATRSIPLAEKPAQTQQSEAERRIQHHTPIRGFAESEPARTLGETLARLDKAGGGICLITMPVSNAYRRAAALAPGFAESRIFFRDIAEAENLKYIDLWDEYPDTLFYDPDHLLPLGAAIVTPDILRRCFGEMGVVS